MDRFGSLDESQRETLMAVFRSVRSAAYEDSIEIVWRRDPGATVATIAKELEVRAATLKGQP